MSFVANISLDRSRRLPLGRVGTLRDRNQKPLDVEVSDISHTGCLIRHNEALPADAIITIGIPGIGRHKARIRRNGAGQYGCEFVAPISTSDLMKAKSIDTVIEAASAWIAERGDIVETAPARAIVYSSRRKAAIIVDASLFLWVVIVGAVFGVMALVG